MKTHKNLIIAGILLLPAASQAAVLASYEFITIDDGNMAVTEALATSSDALVTASNFGLGAGLNTLTLLGSSNNFQVAESNGVADGADDNLADAISAGEYFTFTVTADPGNILDLDNLTFDVRRANNGVNDYAVRSSVDGFATDIIFANQGITTTDTTQDIDLSDASFDSLDSVEFRIYLDDRQGNGSSSSATIFDNFIVNGTVLAVPEPSSAALLGLGGLGLLTRRRR